MTPDEKAAYARQFPAHVGVDTAKQFPTCWWPWGPTDAAPGRSGWWCEQGRARKPPSTPAGPEGDIRSRVVRRVMERIPPPQTVPPEGHGVADRAVSLAVIAPQPAS